MKVVGGGKDCTPVPVELCQESDTSQVDQGPCGCGAVEARVTLSV
jgi:hypothetical protein